MDLSHLYIDFKVIDNNIKSISRRLNDVDDIILVIKADGYGIGASEYARQAEKMGIRFFAVARIEEAIDLRKAGIKSEIIVLANVLENSIKYITQYKLTTAVTDITTLDRVISFCNETSETLSMHLNVDTGMHRLGINISDLDNSLKKISKCDTLKLNGIFTHFASADETTSNFTHEQAAKFQTIYETYKPVYPEIIFHASNSSGLMEFPQYKYDKVRIGIAALGYSASQRETPHWEVKPSLRLTSKIIQIQNISKGDSVGYNQAFIAKKEMKVATIGIGYADGVHRSLSNIGDIIVHDIKCPILGNISMDLISIDITGIDAKLGDEVIIFGKHLKNEISLENLAKQIHSVPYEIITQINPRVKRIYKNRI